MRLRPYSFIITVCVVSSTILCVPTRPAAVAQQNFGGHYQLFQVYDKSTNAERLRHSLDALRDWLKADAQYETVLLSYAGKHSCPDEANLRASALKRYLQSKGISDDRIRIVDAGYRKHWVLEFWLNLRGMSLPPTDPSLKPSQAMIVRPGSKKAKNCRTNYDIRNFE